MREARGRRRAPADPRPVGALPAVGSDRGGRPGRLLVGLRRGDGRSVGLGRGGGRGGLRSGSGRGLDRGGGRVGLGLVGRGGGRGGLGLGGRGNGLGRGGRGVTGLGDGLRGDDAGPGRRVVGLGLGGGRSCGLVGVGGLGYFLCPTARVI